MPVPSTKRQTSTLESDALLLLLDAEVGRDARGLTAEVDRHYPQFTILDEDERVVAIYTSLGYDERQTGKALGQTTAAVKRLLQSGTRKLDVSGKAGLIHMSRRTGSLSDFFS